MAKRKKKKLNDKQEDTLKRMKETRQLDANNLREVINGKLVWVMQEIKRGKAQLEALKIQIARLEGIKLFIEDLLQSPLKEEKKGR